MSDIIKVHALSNLELDALYKRVSEEVKERGLASEQPSCAISVHQIRSADLAEAYLGELFHLLIAVLSAIEARGGMFEEARNAVDMASLVAYYAERAEERASDSPAESGDEIPF